MRRVLLLAFLSVVSALVWGQNTVCGVVLDSLTNEPLPSATVYVNGTTQGTVTDNDGRFELEGVFFPAKVVFSFVGYQPKAVDLVRNPGGLTIGLSPNIELPEIEVSGKANKINKEDLDYFKSMFLGDDKWGKRAKIKNENVLMFDNSFQYSYYTRQISESKFTTQYITNEVFERHRVFEDTVKVVTSVFNAWAYEPLIIDMPLLGYELYVDLVKFTVEKVNNVTSCNMLGYFYYKPYEKLKKRQAKSVVENRQKAYWGSSQHFLRSFAQNCLAENGYLLTKPETVAKGKRNITTYLPLDVDQYSSSVGDNMVQIKGLKDLDLRIRYYQRNDGSPMNFKDRGKGVHRYTESHVTFLEDKCTFLKEGIVMDNDIRFSGGIAKKRIGASLPGDYFPPADSGRTYATESVDYAGHLMKFADEINQFNSLFPQEKVYLEFDNTAYFQGENIWYKAFVTHATTLERAPSGVLYVDFLAPTGQLIMQQKLKIEAGQADGVIPLLDAGTQQTREKRGIVAYPSGYYEIRAYTQNMLDFGPEAIFSRVIPVYTQPKYVGEYNRSKVITDQGNSHVDKIRGEYKLDRWQDPNAIVTFYPEGGHIVKGLPCRVAFKATGIDAFGLEGTLKVWDLWDSVRTVHDGMGSFIVTPSSSFMLADFFPSGSDNKYNFSLPFIESSGYSMISDMLSESQLQVNIWRTQDRIGEQTALAVTCRGEVIHFVEINDNENSQLTIDCSDWPVGVCRLTLFNKEGMVLSSRCIFHNSADYHSPSIMAATDSMSRQSCDKEVIEFKLTDESGNPLRDRFCLSVRDAADYGGGLTENLKTNLLLSSDLRGYIHDPAWYLEKDDEEHREALNLLTMVQGWERYEWQNMTGQKVFEEKHRVEEGLAMNGWILSYGKREPVSDINIYAALMPDDDKTLFESFDYQTDSTGYFGFDLSDFYGKGDFTIHVMATNKNGEYKYKTGKRIRFERADRPEPRPFFKQETDLNHNEHRMYEYMVDFSDADLYQLKDRNLGTVLDAVDVEEEAGKVRFIDYDTFTSFEAEEDAEFELDQGEYTTDIYGYFLEKGLRFVWRKREGVGYGDPGELGWNGIDDGHDVIFGGGTEVIPEDVESKDDYIKDLQSKELSIFFYIHNQEKVLVHKPFDFPFLIDMIDVKSILIYDQPMYLKDLISCTPLLLEFHRKHVNTDWLFEAQKSYERFNLVDIQIKNDNDLLFYSEIRNLGKRSTTVKGFTRPVDFYSPQYPEGPIEGNIDARRTLYWNPNVITDEEGRARVEFYNNSFTRMFTISAAGITASGVPYILNQTW